MAKKKKILVIGDGRSPLLNVTAWAYLQPDYEIIICSGTAIAIDVARALYPFAATVICSGQPLKLLRVMLGQFGASGGPYTGVYFVTVGDEGSDPYLAEANIYPIPAGLVDMAEALSIISRGLNDYAGKMKQQIRSLPRG